MSPLKIKIPSKNMREKATNTPIIHSVYLLCVVVPTCFGITLPPSESVSSVFWETLSWGAVDRILWMGVLWLVTWCMAISDRHHITRHNTPIHNILSTAPELNISQKALKTLPEDGNVIPKHVGAPIHN
jgi:hypothetical protein